MTPRYHAPTLEAVMEKVDRAIAKADRGMLKAARDAGSAEKLMWLHFVEGSYRTLTRLKRSLASLRKRGGG